MIKLENWTEVTKGLYRYVITANASLYIVGDWTSVDNDSKFFERELLLNGPLAACLEKAVEDEEEMRG